MGFIPINKPFLGEGEKRAVREVLDSGILTDASFEGGKYVREFERKLATHIGVKHAIAVNSGTASLQTSLMAFSVKPGDEVIIPAFTFEATANVVLACNAKPVFADIQTDYTIDPDDVRRKITKNTKAIIPVHLYGYSVDLDEIREIAQAHSIRVIEDAAESLGAEYKGRQIGQTDDTGCFSLYATKVITSGEGGAITTNDDGLAEKLRMMRNHGMKEGYDTRILGYNFRLPEVAAAMASVQMERLPEFIREEEERRRPHRVYLGSEGREHASDEDRQKAHLVPVHSSAGEGEGQGEREAQGEGNRLLGLLEDPREQDEALRGPRLRRREASGGIRRRRPRALAPRPPRSDGGADWVHRGRA